MPCGVKSARRDGRGAKTVHVPQKTVGLGDRASASGHRSWRGGVLSAVPHSSRSVVGERHPPIPTARRTRSSPLASTRILGRRTPPFPPFLLPNRVPHGFTQYPSTDHRLSRVVGLRRAHAPARVSRVHARAAVAPRLARFFLRPPTRGGCLGTVDAEGAVLRFDSLCAARGRGA